MERWRGGAGFFFFPSEPLISPPHPSSGCQRNRGRAMFGLCVPVCVLVTFTVALRRSFPLSRQEPSGSCVAKPGRIDLGSDCEHFGESEYVGCSGLLWFWRSNGFFKPREEKMSFLAAGIWLDHKEKPQQRESVSIDTPGEIFTVTNIDIIKNTAYTYKIPQLQS